MANARRFENATQLDILDTYESVLKKSKQASDKLIVVLFNKEFPDRGTIEGRLKNWRHYYENTYGTQFYKCIANKGQQKIKTDFKIEDTPTLVFIREGIEIDRIDDLDEANPTIPNNTIEGEVSKDEKTIKQKLDELCKNP